MRDDNVEADIFQVTADHGDERLLIIGGGQLSRYLALFDREELAPATRGLIIADRYDAAILREPVATPLASSRRRAETLRVARMAARRLLFQSAVLEVELPDEM